MNPSRYQLPQHVSADRLRARMHTLAEERKGFEWDMRDTADDDPQIREEGVRLLPPTVRKLPSEFDFPASTKVSLAADTVRTEAIALASRVSTTLFPLRSSASWAARQTPSPAGRKTPSSGASA